MSERSPQLVNRAFRSYLVATIMSTAAVTFGSVLGSIVVGHLLGSDALGAVSAIMPVVQMLAALNALINIGGATVMSVNVGRGNTGEVRGIFTKSMAMSLVASLVVAVVGVLFIDEIVGFLCDDPELIGMARDYGVLVFALSPLYMMMPGLGTFVRVDNSPRLATVAFLAANAVNIAAGACLMGLTDIGVAGFAMSTGLGYVVGILVLLTHFRKDGCRLGLGRGTVKASEMLSMGAPTSLGMLLIMVNMIGMNILVIDYLGAGGMAIKAVCSDIQLISSIFISGVSQTLQPVGGALYGSEDLTGMRMAVGISTRYQIATVGIIMILALAVPTAFMTLYGVTDPALREDGMRFIRLFAPYLLLKAVVYLIMVIYQVFGHRTLSLTVSVVECVAILVAGFGLTPYSADYIWIGFSIGELVALAYILVVSLAVRRLRPEFSGLALLKRPEGVTFDASVEGDGSTLASVLDGMDSFLRENGVDRGVANRACLCTEEILLNVVQHSVSGNPRESVDLIVRVTDDRVLVTVRDDGEVFDPIKYDGEGYGLMIVKGQCSTLNYARSVGQNNVFIGFDRAAA